MQVKRRMEKGGQLIREVGTGVCGWVWQPCNEEKEGERGHLGKEGVRLDMKCVLQGNSSGCYEALLQYIRITGIMERI